MRYRTPIALLVLALTATALSTVPRENAGALPHPSGHLVVIAMENKERTQVIGSAAAPYINKTLLPSGLLFNQYYGVAHPSLPNYLALTSGSFGTCTSDGCNPGTIGGENLFSQLNVANISWKVYAESMTSNCQTKDASPYIARHNPAIFYTNLTTTSGDGTCGTNDVRYTTMAKDMAAGTLPSFSWVTPNAYHDMHEVGGSTTCTSPWAVRAEVCQGDAWLKANLPAILSDGGANDVTVVVVWDEGSSSLGGGGHTLMIEKGPDVCAGCTDNTNFNHYGLLSAIDDWFALPELGPRMPGL